MATNFAEGPQNYPNVRIYNPDAKSLTIPNAQQQQYQQQIPQQNIQNGPQLHISQKYFDKLIKSYKYDPFSTAAKIGMIIDSLRLFEEKNPDVMPLKSIDIAKTLTTFSDSLLHSDINQVIDTVLKIRCTSLAEAAFYFKILKFRRVTTVKSYTSTNDPVITVNEKKSTNLDGGNPEEWSADNYPYIYEGLNIPSAALLGNDNMIRCLIVSNIISCSDLNRAIFIANVNGKYEFFKDKKVIKLRPCYSKKELKKIRVTKKDIMKHIARSKNDTLENALLALNTDALK